MNLEGAVNLTALFYLEVLACENNLERCQFDYYEFK